MKYKNDLAIIIVNRDRPDLTDTLVESLDALKTKNGKDIFVIEMGSQKDNLSKYCSYYYEETEFRGKAYGHNRGLDYVLENHGRYRYYWFLMNDLVFEKDPNPIDTMIGILDSEPRMGIISPTESGFGYAGSRPRKGRDWHKVSTTDYLALLMKDTCLREVGFLGRHFKYSWGAIHELSYKMYQNGWFIAYCDRVLMEHLGGTTYGATRNTISREQYTHNARMWCARYFLETYGEDWDRKFSACLPTDIEINSYPRHRKFWERGNVYILIDAFLKQVKETPQTDPFIVYLEKNIDDLITDLKKIESSQKELAKTLKKHKNTDFQSIYRSLEANSQKKAFESQIDSLFLQVDKQNIKRTKNIRLVPEKQKRTGGKISYGEWCHVIGIFQTMMHEMLDDKTGNRILDVGCGTGLLGIAAEPFVGGKGEYVGLDVNKDYIDICKNQYNLENYTFIHHEVKNSFYAGEQPDVKKRWPLESNSFDLVTALSVWTHLDKEDALFYLEETARVLKPKKKAIITFFYLNREYYDSLKIRKGETGRYHMTDQNRWIFDKKVPNSEHWFSPYDIPEKAAGIDEQGMEELAKRSKLKRLKIYNGNWKEIPGIYFQDIVIFQKD